MKTSFAATFALAALASAAFASGPTEEAQRRAAAQYEQDKALCAEDSNPERRMQCLRDARTVYQNAIGGAPASVPAPAAPPSAPVAAPAPAAVPATAALPACPNCGTVVALREVKSQGDASGVGMIAGGVAGAVLGNQVGRGTGRRIATIGGAAGGAYAGHQIEKNMRSNSRWEIAVRMDDGSERLVSTATRPAIGVGDKVRVEGTSIVRR
jgi:outer membrane lipoprotein SlyB